MYNKDLIYMLNSQIDNKSKEIGRMNMKQIELRMEIQHLKSAIKVICDSEDAFHAPKEDEDE